MKAKLTAKTVNALKPGVKEYKVWDTEVRGFTLRVAPTGGMVYYLEYRTRDGRRKSYRIGAGLTPVQARDVAAALAADIAHGIDIQAKKQQERAEAKQAKAKTLGGFLERKYGPWVKANRKTGQATLDRINFNFPHLMSRSLEDVNTWVVEKWRTEQRKSGKAAVTINRDIVTLKAALSKAVAWKLIKTNPLSDLKQLKTDGRRRVRYLTDDEECRLRTALRERDDKIKRERDSANRWRRERGYQEYPDLKDCQYADHLTPMVLLTLNTGLRRGEVFDLTWEHVNFKNCVLTVEGFKAKSGQTRHVPLNDEAMSVLSAWRAQGRGDYLVFPGKEGNRLDNVRNSWAKALEEAAIKDFRWHDLRHHFASALVMKSVPLNTIRELLGHADMTTTLRYAHLAPDHKADAVAMLSRSSKEHR